MRRNKNVRATWLYLQELGRESKLSESFLRRAKNCKRIAHQWLDLEPHSHLQTGGVVCAFAADLALISQCHGGVRPYGRPVIGFGIQYAGFPAKHSKTHFQYKLLRHKTPAFPAKSGISRTLSCLRNHAAACRVRLASPCQFVMKTILNYNAAFYNPSCPPLSSPTLPWLPLIPSAS